MAYDAGLAERIRALVRDDPAVTEQRMFGGLAFLVDGNMAVAAAGEGGLMVRIDPSESARFVAMTHVRAMEMRGRPLETEHGLEVSYVLLGLREQRAECFGDIR